MLGIATTSIALLAVLSGIVFVRVRADRLGDLDQSLRSRARSMAALVERDHGAWETDLEGSPEGSATLVGELSLWEIRVYPEGPVIARGPAASVALFDERRVLVPAIAGAPSATHPYEVNGRVETRVIAGREMRVWDGLYLVRSDDEPSDGEDGGDGSEEERADPGPPLVRIAAAQDLEPLAADFRSLLGTLVGAGTALAACALFLGWLLSRRIVGPIERMARRAEEVSSPASEPALPRDGTGDEVDRLAGTLNATFARLHQAWARQARFTADASHELRTPLSVIRSQAEVGLWRGRTPDEYRGVLTAIVEGAGRMEETLEGLLLMARAEARARPEFDDPVELREVARKAMASVAEAARGLDLRVEAPEEAFVAGDARQLEILVRNLLTNAVRHAPPPGEIVVAVYPEGDTWVLEVRDSGEGIPADALPHIFERFYRVDEARARDRGGSGLGLSIVQVIAEQHGGSVAASSTPGKGTVITVRFPQAPS